MSFSRCVLFTLFLSLLCPARVWAELPGIRVMVSNLSPAAGTVEVTLFDSAESFLKTPYLQQSGEADEDGNFQTEFVALPDGDYALVVVHDANGNGKLDAGFLGFGGERFGYSNNAKSWFGRPDFDAAKIRVDQPATLVEIDLD